MEVFLIVSVFYVYTHTFYCSVFIFLYLHISLLYSAASKLASCSFALTVTRVVNSQALRCAARPSWSILKFHSVSLALRHSGTDCYLCLRGGFLAARSLTGWETLFSLCWRSKAQHLAASRSSEKCLSWMSALRVGLFLKQSRQCWQCEKEQKLSVVLIM